MSQAETKCPKCGATFPLGHQMCVHCGTRLPGSQPGTGPGQGGAKDAKWYFRPGQVVASRYTVINMIGRGGMGCIYKVHDNTLEEDVALKTLLPRFTNDQHVVDRFFNEARIARQLSHPNIVRVHDIGMAGTVVYISMEYVRGRSLREWLDSIPAGQCMPIAYALRLMIQLSAALEFAHKFTVHRDLKPENVMITERGQVKLMDFGISKLRSNVQLTSAQMVMGTPKYMSPEQLKDSSKVDHRTDIYALGAMLYEVLTGNVPTGLAQRPSQIRNETPPELDAIVSRCLALDPNDRYQSAVELRGELQRLLEMVEKSTGIEIPEFEIPIPQRVSAGFPLKKILGVLAAVLVVVLAAAGVWRLERIPSGDDTSNAGTPPEPAASRADPFEVAFDDLAARVERAREAAVAMAAREAAAPAGMESGADAEGGAANQGNASNRMAQTTYVNEGDASWKNAQELASRRQPDAFQEGWHALECYLGPVICPVDMAFVPPGETVVEQGRDPVFVDGFFIEKLEVSGAQFRAFALEPNRNWHLPGYLAAPVVEESVLALPVVGVTFYDALAYAASAAPASWGKRTLPTEAQWARAAYGGARSISPYPWGTEWDTAASSAAGDADGYPGSAPPGSFESDRSSFGCYDVAGNVMEWTRSVFASPYERSRADVALDDIWFGSVLSVRGGCYNESEVPLTERRSAAFDEANSFLGFRCVLPFPADLETVDAVLPR
ncbi:MAG TPA: bifunctional serine/threonine-protein kinase/formylglycine-generating enzyme family protein [Candidatus Hydrogenedentes bacterium]|nr:bifunctional serine/threonine-protein kinase/formylglycine-generating enzyme family protein [Candidatus Hydrogenedentota bacterium]